MSTNNSTKLRLGFIGCGRHSSRTIQSNAHLAEEIELIAVCDRDESLARRAANRWGVKAHYTDFAEMVEKESPDAVAVVGPPTMMQPITREMLGRGIHVFTEKPPALSSEDAMELVLASEDGGAFGMMGTHWRHSQPARKAREVMSGERFGEPSHCYGSFYAPGPTSNSGEEWGNLDALNSYLFQQAVHLVDCTRAYMGEVEEVYASAKHTDETFDSCSVTVSFANGATGVLSMASRSPYWFGHRLFGTGGGVIETRNNREISKTGPPYWSGENSPNYDTHAFQNWSPAEQSGGYHGGGYLEELTQFAQCVLSGKQPVASMVDGLRAIQVLEAISESVRSGKPISPG